MWTLTNSDWQFLLFMNLESPVSSFHSINGILKIIQQIFLVFRKNPASIFILGLSYLVGFFSYFLPCYVLCMVCGLHEESWSDRCLIEAFICSKGVIPNLFQRVGDLWVINTQIIGMSSIYTRMFNRDLTAILTAVQPQDPFTVTTVSVKKRETLSKVRDAWLPKCRRDEQGWSGWGWGDVMTSLGTWPWALPKGWHLLIRTTTKLSQHQLYFFF